MAFADLLADTGSMGRFQVLNVALLVLPILILSCHNLLQNFTAATPGHRCRLPCDTNATGCLGRLASFVPLDREGQAETCVQFLGAQGELLNPEGPGGNGTHGATEPCGDGWTYDRSVFASTIVTEWDLVCSSRSLKQMAQSIYMAGVLVGAVVFGSLSDKFGRKSLLIWSCLQMAVTGSCAAFAPSFTTYCLFRFLTGMALSGISLNCMSLAVEWTPTNVRAVVGMVTGYSYSVGQFLLAGVAYVIPDWRWLQLAVSLPYFVFFLYSWWFTESARWLATAGRLDQALKALKKVAHMNGRTEEADKLSIEVLRSNLRKEILARSTHTAADLVRTPAVRRISCCLCFVWFSTSFAYYGLAMDLQKFGVSIYLIQVIFGAVDIPAKLIGFCVINFIGRRVTQATALLLAGLAILANIFVPQDLQTMRTVLAVFGKGCLAASFNCVFLYTGELYPTVIRQTGMGLGNTLARVGGIVAPLVRMTSDYSPSLPLIIYGAAPVISGIATCFLPETLNMPLPDTIEDVERQRCSEMRWKDTIQQPSHPDPHKEVL
ncbi:solute carrier family 22 member 6 isoform X2 [Alligator mississippiensis]|uniref:solute carrier family 22 member 6 isoform X2 n=1 Tax=Alligator mississippiensis TaxID=8496 RepID=UPI0006EC8389|nr:solute carrier family 22 member 6 isoform X2 [Alligator mississippiensis]